MDLEDKAPRGRQGLSAPCPGPVPFDGREWAQRVEIYEMTKKKPKLQRVEQGKSIVIF